MLSSQEVTQTPTPVQTKPTESQNVSETSQQTVEDKNELGEQDKIEPQKDDKAELQKSNKKAEKKRKATERLQQKEALDLSPVISSPSPFIERIDEVRWRIKKGFVPNMRTDGIFYANDFICKGLFDELRMAGGMVPAIRQIANVAGLPGIVGCSIGMPDAHSGYGFAIGNVAATDMDDPEAIVSPGGVGYDINCGMRLLRTNLTEDDVKEPSVRERLGQLLFNEIPVGVGSESEFRYGSAEFDRILTKGMEYLVEQKVIWPEDLETCEEGGRMKFADAKKVSARAKKRGSTQAGTLGAGNHYAEVQIIDEVYDERAAQVMGLKLGQVVVMIHSGSRGLGHQICSDFLCIADAQMRKYKIVTNDRQLTGLRINSEEGQNYLAAMGAAANFAFVNRSLMSVNVRNVFSRVFKKSARDLGMYLVYDVAHNMAKIEEHVMPDGSKKKLLVHRKGATRCFAPNHPSVPEKYHEIGQPVIIGGSMGTHSYVLTGTHKAMQETFGSTCHGAGRILSRAQAKKTLTPSEVMASLRAKGIVLKVSSTKLVPEEAPDAYKDVDEVVGTCQQAGISKLCARCRPIVVVKG